MYQVLYAVEELHDNRILHRDLQPDNILISQNCQVKIANFELARSYSIPDSQYTQDLTALWYRAPESLLCKRVPRRPMPKIQTPSIRLLPTFGRSAAYFTNCWPSKRCSKATRCLTSSPGSSAFWACPRPASGQKFTKTGSSSKPTDSLIERQFVKSFDPGEQARPQFDFDEKAVDLIMVGLTPANAQGQSAAQDQCQQSASARLF